MDDEKLLRFDRVVVGLNAYVAALPAKVQASCDVLVKLSCHVPGEPCPRRYYAIVGKLVKQPIYSIWVQCEWDRLENDHRDTDVEQCADFRSANKDIPAFACCWVVDF
jgi:hypothetical protein